MNLLIYGILCEDKAHRNFIEHYLRQYHPNRFLESEEFGWRISASNAQEVDDTIKDAARQGFTKYGLDVLVVCRDADSTNIDRIEKLKEAHYASCGTFLDKTIFMIPVQCVEHWLLYIKRHRDNPASTKNETLEPIRRIEAKRMVYGDVKKVPRQIEIASEILTDFDADWLEQRSDSFKLFHQRVKAFVAR